MTTEQIEEERRHGRIAGIAAIVGIVIFVGAMGLAGDFNGAESGRAADSCSTRCQSDLLIQCSSRRFALLLFIPGAGLAVPLGSDARRERFGPGLIGVVIVSPVLLALSLVVAYFAVQAGRPTPSSSAGPFDHTTVSNSNDVAERRLLRPVPDPVPHRASGSRLARARLHDRLPGVERDASRPDDPVLGNARRWRSAIGTLLFGSLMLVGYMIVIALLVAALVAGGPAARLGRRRGDPVAEARRPGRRRAAGRRRARRSRGLRGHRDRDRAIRGGSRPTRAGPAAATTSASGSASSAARAAAR